jgi:hypothetical protein
MQPVFFPPARPYPHSLPIAFITNLLLMIKGFIRRRGLLSEKRPVKAGFVPYSTTYSSLWPTVGY